MEKAAPTQKTTEKASALPVLRSQPERPQLEQQPLHPLLHLQRTIGNQAVLRLLQAGAFQAKLEINQPGDPYELEADRVAEQVVASRVNPSLQRKCACEGGTPCPKCKEEGGVRVQRKVERAAPVEGNSLPDNFVGSLGPGQPLDPGTRSFFEPRFGHNFSQVRVHTDARAAESARAVNALAYTVGRDVVFGAGRYVPGTKDGRWLLAHELAHTLQQQRTRVRRIQRSRLGDFKDTKPEHDPSKLTDKEIEATIEFKAYMDPKLVWQWKDKVTKDEALLACRLILRQLREGKAVTWKTDARVFMNLARKQLGTLKEAEKLVGKLEWVPAAEAPFKTPATASDDFIKWALGGGPEPTDTSKMNCWEMIMFAAFQGGFTSKKWIQDLYGAAAKKTGLDIPAEIEKSLCRSPRLTLDPKDPKSPEPLPGDIVIFDVIAKHAALSLGTKVGGEHEVISHWTPPGPAFSTKVKKTTIEKLLPYAKLTQATFCTSPW